MLKNSGSEKICLVHGSEKRGGEEKRVREEWSQGLKGRWGGGGGREGRVKDRLVGEM